MLSFAAPVAPAEGLTTAGHTPQQAPGTGELSTTVQLPPPSPFLSQVDWGEAPDVGGFTGRQAELAELQRPLGTEP